MKTLILVRHAKSSWKHDFIDIDRPLSSRGLRDANLLSNEILKFKLKPDAIFSSPANRALTTCNIFMDNCNYPSKILTITKELYDFGGKQVTRFVKALDDVNDIVMIFGHNEAFTLVSNALGNKFIDNVPTCGFVVLEFDINSWKNIDKGHTKLTLFPKELRK